MSTQNMHGLRNQRNPDNPDWYRTVLSHYPTGVCIITSVGPDGSPAAMVVGSFTSVSLAPPLIGFFPDKKSNSWPKVKQAGRFCVNILAADQLDLCKQMASKNPDKFNGVGYRLSENGSPLFDGVVAWMDCDLESVTEAGDHYFVLGSVQKMDTERESPPLVFNRGQYGKFQQGG